MIEKLIEVEEKFKTNLNQARDLDLDSEQTLQKRLMAEAQTLVREYELYRAEFMQLDLQTLTLIAEIKISAPEQGQPSLEWQKAYAVQLKVQQRLEALTPPPALSPPVTVRSQPSDEPQLHQSQIDAEIEKAHLEALRLPHIADNQRVEITLFDTVWNGHRFDKVFESVLVDSDFGEAHRPITHFYGPKLLFRMTQGRAVPFRWGPLSVKYVVFGNYTVLQKGNRGFKPNLTDIIVAPVQNSALAKMLFPIVAKKSQWESELKVDADLVMGNGTNAPWLTWSLINVKADIKYTGKYRDPTEVLGQAPNPVEQLLLRNKTEGIHHVSLTLPPIALLDAEGRTIAGELPVGDLNLTDLPTQRWSLLNNPLHERLGLKAKTSRITSTGFDRMAAKMAKESPKESLSWMRTGNNLELIHLDPSEANVWGLTYGSFGLDEGRFKNPNYFHAVELINPDRDISLKILFQNNLPDLFKRPISFRSNHVVSQYQNPVEVWVGLGKSSPTSVVGYAGGLSPASEGVLRVRRFTLDSERTAIASMELEFDILPRKGSDRIYGVIKYENPKMVGTKAPRICHDKL